MTTEKTVVDLIASGEALYTAITGGTVSTTAADNINDVGSIISLGVNVADRSITAVDVSGIVSGLAYVVDGITQVIAASKTKKAATTTTADTAAAAS